MLIKGEGGPADPKRAVKMLTASRASDAPGIRGALGRLYIDGKLVPQDLAKGVDLLRTWVTWDYDARLELLALLATHPELTMGYPEPIIYDVTEAVELGEPGAAEALIDLKLSPNKNYAGRAGGCALAASEAKRGNGAAARRLKDCN